jgi:hypothetical protein
MAFLHGQLASASHSITLDALYKWGVALQNKATRNETNDLWAFIRSGFRFTSFMTVST